MIPLLLLVNMSLTFCWTYLDLFIMLVGISLAARFNQVTDRIKRMENMIIPESFWTEIRSHYLLLNELVLYVDDRLSLILLLSCASNLYFVCLQLFNSFTSNYSDIISTVFFWFSLLFVMGRAVCCLLCVASIHEATKGPLRILRRVPTKHWSVELGRFSRNIAKDTIALTGRKFFYITKRLVLVMAGTVVTYELVVFDQVDKENASAGENGTHPCNWTTRQHVLYYLTGCYQLLNIFNILPYTTSQIYFWYSLIYLILRSLCLLLCTSEINDQSKRPLVILKTIPTYAWCVELDRFIHQTSKETICLTGMRFFFFTRKLVLSMIGTVVTYELVLMQFDLNKNEVDTHENEIVFRYDCVNPL
ncbi:gustatory receptor for sugar taste 64a-like [Phlebotomus papatasi]|uniref:gustatory receptor for sugar taste 64a-like n=1 Tax=Phlebotomus papatasi TaxID=29031 RepID=UPI002483E612|nr:gustatory receptor for sugar taste 64a-like [Phlebotomus papatasi]